ncbi:MAG TPA: glycosyltransferase [Beutenbergiaceae bacterium]|nr:glycosyltransferase [Beutenbergiaceae bacterium]
MPARPLRVALISLHTSPLADAGAGDAGGMNIMVRHSAEAMAAVGHEVVVFTRRTDPHSPDVQPLAPRAVVHQLRAGPAAPVSKEHHEELIAPFAAVLAQHWDGWDVVHSHHWFSGMAAQPLAAAHGQPHVQTFHSITAGHNRPLDEGEPAESPGRADGERHLAQASEAVVAVSDAERTTAITRLGAQPEHVQVVRPGVDVDRFRPIGGHHPPALVLAARLEPLKGVDLAIRALALVPEDIRPTLHVLGAPSSAYPGYDDQLVRLGQRVGVSPWLRFSGAVSRAVLAHSFAAASAVLVPSHSETFGLTALEASACGVPVIASGAGGLSEAVLDEVTGLIVPRRDPRQWADAITSLLQDSDYAANLGAAGRQFALSRTWQATAAGWVDVYRQVMAQRPVAQHR